MARWRSKLVVLVAMPAVLLCATACSSNSDSPASSPSPSVSMSASLSPSPTPSLAPGPAAVIVGMEGLTVVDVEGSVLEELSYRTPGIDVAQRLTKVFGVTPTQTDFGGSFEAWPSRNYDWGGFVMFDEMRGDPSKAVWYDFVIRVAVSSVNGVDIRTSSGARVGGPESQVHYDPSDRYRYEWDGQSCGVEAWFSPSGNIEDAVYLHICSSTETGLVEFFDVPAQLQV